MPEIQTTLNRIEGFKDLAQGWHFGEGEKISEILLEKAKVLVELAGFWGITRSDAFPGTGGEIRISFYVFDDLLEITLEADGAVTLYLEENDEEVFYKENASFPEVFGQINALRVRNVNEKLKREVQETLWPTLESLMSTSTSTLKKTDSTAWRFDPMALAFQFSSALVARNQQDVPVITYRPFIQTDQDLPLYSGNYRMKLPAGFQSSSLEVLQETIAMPI